MSDLPCPFCGNSAIVRSSVIPGRGFCEECGAEGPWSPYFEGDWNTRAPDPRVAALMETLQDVADECLSDEIPEGYGPDLTENPEFHRGYDAALHRVRKALAAFNGGEFDPVVEALRDSPLVIEIVQAAREVLRISDRDHDAWRRLRAALSAVEGDDGADRGQP